MIRSIIYTLLIQSFVAAMFILPASAGTAENPKRKALRIVKNNADLTDGIGQLLVVFSEIPGSNSATLVAMEKKGTRWVVAHAPFRAGIGRNGFALPGSKREGDGQSPSGLFRLGKLFSYEKDVNTEMPFIQTTAEDKWIDDPDSPDYNQYIRGNTRAKSFENLKISSDEYKYCMVIEYNMHPVVKGMGSAIFLHLSQDENTNPSAGCVVITPRHMEQLLKWMKPDLKPSILMGNDKVLMSGLKSQGQK